MSSGRTPFYIHGRRARPREDAAIILFVAVSYKYLSVSCLQPQFGLTKSPWQVAIMIVLTIPRVIYSIVKQRPRRQFPVLGFLLSVAFLRVAFAGVELAVAPERRSWATESSIAILDAVALVPLMWMLLAAPWSG